ncbi:Phospho-N-acetylmuramoyl-pentapeptide-transferase [hydrothermal vent metagenome]|uniref:Phospho-N-acetylmuramoyl-pentapeptide-transferase n=1 Tax=hydrothermal vent metagenome TaxID=652676 RepID=A0A3B0YRA9_9ZZZZ
MSYFFGFLSALFISMALIPMLMRVAQRFSIVDVPNDRKVHVCAIPRIGGIAMVAGVLISVLMWEVWDKTYLALLLGIIIITVFGIWDDRTELGYRTKFFGQFLAVCVVVFFGDIVIERIPFFSFDILPAYVGIPLTIVALLGVTNAVNLADGLDGLAGGLVLISFCGIALLTYLAGAEVLLLWCVIIMGSILGFLRYNTWPAQLFMGDTGSQFLGFTLGVVVILLTQQEHMALSPLVGLLLIGIPIIDTFMVMSQRLMEKRSPFTADRGHIHHKFLDMDFDHYEAVFFIYVIQALMIAVAYFFRYDSDILLLAIYIFIFSSVVLFFKFAPQSRKISLLPHLPFQQFVNWLKVTGWSVKGPLRLINYSVAGLFILLPFFVETVPREFSWVIMLMLSFFVLALNKRDSYKFQLLEQFVVFTTCILIISLLWKYPGVMTEYNALINIYIAILAVVVMLGVRFSRGKIFRATPLDFIVLFLAVLLPFLGEEIFKQLGEITIKLIVLLYAIEFVWGSSQRRIVFRIATLVALVVLGLRSFG